uniref:ARAD1A11154p n=1 Tax=Blastobotrys adeninivorans TaxID=409370 RepID=A0A060T3N8_BLAAD
MNRSSGFTYSGHCVPALSPDGTWIAYILSSSLVFRRSDLSTKQVVPLSPDFSRLVQGILWDENTSEGAVAVFTRSQAQIYLFDESVSEFTCSATIKDDITGFQWASSASEELVRVATMSPDFVRLWSSDGIEKEIINPKWPQVLGGPAKGYISSVTRHGTADEISIFSTLSGRYYKFPFEGILDAKQAKWSPKGSFLAVVDTSALGYRVHIYGAEGSLLKAYRGHSDDQVEGGEFGVDTIEWIPGASDNERLAIGDEHEEVTILDTANFSAPVILKHGSIQDGVPIWVEATRSSVVHYNLVSAPYIPPQLRHSTDVTTGIVALKVSPNGIMLGTVTESMPSTVWVWYLDGDNTYLASVMCHSYPISSIEWNGQWLYTVCPGSKLVGRWSISTAPMLTALDDFDSLSGATVRGRFTLFYNRNVFSIAQDEDEPEHEQDEEDQKDLVGQDQENQEDEGISMREREGSPQMLLDDDTNVQEIVKTVQQSEWCEPAEALHPDDTFTRKRN